MNRLNREINAKTTAERWAIQYPPAASFVSNSYPLSPNGNSGKLERLRALGSDPDPDAVDAIIGNTSWTTWGLHCSECEKLVSNTITFSTYDSTICLCEGCLRKALELLK